jgi:hypothetical protein
MKKNDFSVSLSEKNDIREKADFLLREAGIRRISDFDEGNREGGSVEGSLHSRPRSCRLRDGEIGAPVKELSNRFGTGNYATLRRYTMECGKQAALLVCDPSSSSDPPLKVRRFIPSPEFETNFEPMEWPDSFRDDSWFALNRPRNQFLMPTG